MNYFIKCIQLFIYKLKKEKFSGEILFSELVDKLKSRDNIYRYMHHYFIHKFPNILVEHRNYFKKDKRGYGEDAFHAMWFKIFEEYRPSCALEIGVYRGQVITLWGMLAKINKIECKIFGLSPFSAAGDDVSKYLKDIDYIGDIKYSCNYFNLDNIELVRHLSTDRGAISFIKSNRWDLIYIDGSHDYEDALSDYEVSKDSLVVGGILVIDDSSLFTDYKPPKFSFKGHPGPSRIVTEHAMNEMKFICGVGHNNVFQKIS